MLYNNFIRKSTSELFPEKELLKGKSFFMVNSFDLLYQGFNLSKIKIKINEIA